ncbi:MAG: hypothetical protein ABSE04_01725 [Candidatus Microgenomates bacterium]|jgi:hypothetical protein
MNDNNPSPNLSPDELTRKGEEIYLNDLKDKLEQTNRGEYVVIEVDSGKYFIDKDVTVALEKAKTEYPQKLFFIVQIGTLQRNTLNYKQAKNEWLF